MKKGSIICQLVSGVPEQCHAASRAEGLLVNIFGLAMKHGITASQIRDFVFAYPTFSADIKSML